MSRKAVPLTLDHLAALDAPCRECVFWELDPVRRARLGRCREGGAGRSAEPTSADGPSDPPSGATSGATSDAASDATSDATSEKEAWLSHVLREWGSCGRVVLVDGRPVGHATYAPAAFVPGSEGFATAPVSPDAVLLTALWVHPRHRGGGLGRILVQGMARDLITRGGIRAVEAFGEYRGPSRSCLVPADFLGRVGFKTHRQHAHTPRLRMELRSALTWRDEVEAALGRLVDAVRPERAPSPAPKATRTVREN